MLAILHLRGGERGERSLDKDAVTSGTATQAETFLFIASQGEATFALFPQMLNSYFPEAAGEIPGPVTWADWVQTLTARACHHPRKKGLGVRARGSPRSWSHDALPIASFPRGSTVFCLALKFRRARLVSS